VIRIADRPVMPSKPWEKVPGSNNTVVSLSPSRSPSRKLANRHEWPKCVSCMPILWRRGLVHVRLILAVALAMCGLAITPGTARPVPGVCPPICNAIPDAAWIEPSSIPLFPVYRWPGLAGLAVTATTPRFEFEAWCAGPAALAEPRDYAVAARAVVPKPPGQWNLRVQVLHWRGDTTTGGGNALLALENARIALSNCHRTAARVSPSVTTSDAERLATVISEPGLRVMHTYLLADPSSSTLVELSLWATLPLLVEWPPISDPPVFDAMAGPLCSAYLGSCR
jgi:hypothetical protein